MAEYGVCEVCECVVRASNFGVHRAFHQDLGSRDPGPHGYHDIESAHTFRQGGDRI